MNTQDKIIAARRIVRLEEKKTAIMAFLDSEEVKNSKYIKIDYSIGASVKITGKPYDFIVKALTDEISAINQEIYDTNI